ncbi:hypothetical protein JYU34_021353 [Plutella xylostella]|uniref:Reverse transcriptase domain-containing protein n=1 Tax=Plutella xylostella TaxID=51655 RepID=A0ABQ7PUP7_PLUXY|nr:hypothetical protein JYU34_021353 [Plutella xylostella]
MFYNVLDDLIQRHVPTRPVRNSDGHAPWYSRALIKLTREKRNFHTRWKKYGNPLDYETFKLLRSREKKLERECYHAYIQFAESNIKQSPKYFWRFIKSKFNSNNIPSQMIYNNKVSQDGQIIADMFNNYFQSVFEPNCISNDCGTLADDPNAPISISSIHITQEIVLKHLEHVDVSKGAGCDGIHPLFISKCAKQLVVPLSIIYKKSIGEGCFPELWKRAIVTPIYKSGNKQHVPNYRPISKLNIFGKIFEKIVTQELSLALSQHISPYQHGFLKGRSVDTNLVTYTDFILNAMDVGCQVDAVYTDFSKAFDKIDHHLLIKKLLGVGVHGDLLRWLRSYVLNRSQAVSLKGHTSQFLPISSGVPQGSHLGPLLFTLYINDLDTIFDSSCHLLYADDAKIFKIISTTSDCVELQYDLNKFVNYCEDNNMRLNVDKCYCITFTRKQNTIDYTYNLHGDEIKRVYKIRDLGVILDSKLHFNLHVDNIINRAFKNLGLILRLGQPFKDPSTYIILYYAYVRSTLEFCSVVWNPQYTVHIDRIEKIQNKFTKALDYRVGNFFLDYKTSAKRYNLVSLQNRRKLIDASFFFKILNNQVDSPTLLENITFRVPRAHTRFKDTFHASLCNTNYAKNSFFRRCARLMDREFADVDIFHNSLNSFKNLVLKSFKY